MSILSSRESAVYELLKQRVRPVEILRRTGLSNSTLYDIIKRLVEMNFVQKRQREIIPLVVSYETNNETSVLYRMRIEQSKLPNVDPFEKVTLTASIEAFLRDNFHLKRSEIVNSTGLPRYVINRELMRMNLDKDRVKRG